MGRITGFPFRDEVAPRFNTVVLAYQQPVSKFSTFALYTLAAGRVSIHGETFSSKIFQVASALSASGHRFHQALVSSSSFDAHAVHNCNAQYRRQN